MSQNMQWDGKSKGSVLGQKIVFILISIFGVVPAYLLCIFICIHYTRTNKKASNAIRIFRTHLGLKTSVLDTFRHFYAFAISLVDRYAFLIGKNKLFSFESIQEDLIPSMLDKKKGVIILGAHIGNWEIAGNLLSNRITADINLVMMDAEEKAMKKIMQKASRNRKMKVIPVNKDPLELVINVKNALAANEIVCFHGDRLFGQKGQEHEFLGEKVQFPLGPFIMAATTGSPIVPVIITKKGFKKYVFKAYAPIQFDGVTRENRDKYIFTALERYVGILEQVVKEYPDQWFNFYDFWETDKKE